MPGKDAKYPKVSVITVTYNAEKTLQHLLDSVFSQKYLNLELVIIDGKSTDGTVAILETNNNKIAFWQSEKDSGVYDAMNKALGHITGDWVYFIGADDELLPEFSDMLHELTNPTAIYYANVFSNGGKRSGELTRYQMAKIGLFHQAIVYPKAVFNKYRYDTRYHISADFALTLKLCADKDFHFVYKDYTLANFNHTGLSGITIDHTFQKDRPGLVFKNFGLQTWFRYRLHRYKQRHNPRA